MPEVARLLAQDGAEGVVAIAVAPRAWEDDYAEVFFVSLGEGGCRGVCSRLIECHHVILEGTQEGEWSWFFWGDGFPPSRELRRWSGNDEKGKARGRRDSSDALGRTLGT